MSNSEPERWQDEWGNVHILTEELAKGGQGVVYKTTDPDIVIKFALQNGGTVDDEQSVKQQNAVYERIRLFPIPRGINIALPLARIKGRAGYVMRLLNDMESFGQFGFMFVHYPKLEGAKIPKYCGNDVELAERLVYYQKTGGLRRRLNALAAAAGILGRLHSAGFVYGDVSQNNIYISKDLTCDAVWFLDADNIRYAGHSDGPIWTPMYGAPEIVTGRGQCTWMSDVYAFAVMAYWMLTTYHPFEGAAMNSVDEDNDDDWANDSNDGGGADLYDGRFAFVDDPDDDSNRRAGVQSEVFVNAPLRRLFEKTFCEGKNEPKKRVPMIVWARVLHEAAESTVECPECGQSYYNSNKQCPYCEAIAPGTSGAKSKEETV